MTTSKKAVSSTPGIRVGPSTIHGLGAFATRDMPAGTFLGFYDGRRYNAEQIAAKTWDDQLTYLFTLSDGMTIDGGKGGNGTRHLNHCCDPNCEAVEEYDDAGRLLLRFQTLEAVEAG
ncbi:MAG: SET domain-containing protein, partial [Pseudomonadota bacterium]